MVSVTGTPRRALEALRDGPRQAKEVGEALGIDASAAWRHLEALRRDGLVDAERVVEGRGRPKKRYALTAAGEEAFPRAYGLLASALARRIAEADGEARLRDHLGAVARDLAVGLPDGGSAALLSLVERYEELGFETSLDEEGSAIVHRNCPFLQVAREHPGAFCEGLEVDLVRRALPGARVDVEETLAGGAPRCRLAVRLPSGGAPGAL